MDELDETLERLRGGLRKDAVAQVEDVAAASTSGEDLEGPILDHLPGSQQHRGVEVPLQHHATIGPAARRSRSLPI